MYLPSACTVLHPHPKSSIATYPHKLSHTFEWLMLCLCLYINNWLLAGCIPVYMRWGMFVPCRIPCETETESWIIKSIESSCVSHFLTFPQTHKHSPSLPLSNTRTYRCVHSNPLSYKVSRIYSFTLTHTFLYTLSTRHGGQSLLITWLFPPQRLFPVSCCQDGRPCLQPGVTRQELSLP